MSRAPRPNGDQIEHGHHRAPVDGARSQMARQVDPLVERGPHRAQGWPPRPDREQEEERLQQSGGGEHHLLAAVQRGTTPPPPALPAPAPAPHGVNGWLNLRRAARRGRAQRRPIVGVGQQPIPQRLGPQPRPGRRGRSLVLAPPDRGGGSPPPPRGQWRRISSTGAPSSAMRPRSVITTRCCSFEPQHRLLGPCPRGRGAMSCPLRSAPKPKCLAGNDLEIDPVDGRQRAKSLGGAAGPGQRPPFVTIVIAHHSPDVGHRPPIGDGSDSGPDRIAASACRSTSALVGGGSGNRDLGPGVVRPTLGPVRTGFAWPHGSPCCAALPSDSP